ncbi:MAG: 16S rRNA (cytosine(967)-C(5))-methyltransferase RsmB [Candidatus Thiodiazotropha sp. (ex Dulcina madagascariensis)]|nr:16S rRNA (cytosine(967)-C(5))-methyltransferase RsmB [Candidatus Thiodiazotropha sp. (ex Dulcina madagascariensis)]MCU7924893.1 16S rRNA (cytosine(967)-C(5))-methyltransferase RsmB [Candidatus Thiodiazotropha sp. (ex Dulcina madagascariensis)]
MGIQARVSSTNPRIEAARVVQGVLAGRSLTELMPDHLAKLDDSRDRGLMQEISYGVMRAYPRLRVLAGCLMSKPLKSKDRDIEALILIGLYQLLYLRVAEHAAVHETAGAAKRLGKGWAVGLINGVLRNFLRRREGLLESLASDPEAHYALPEWLLSALRSQWPTTWRERAEALNGHPPMSLRVNRRINSRDEYLALLAANGMAARPIPLVDEGLNLEKAVDVESLPGFREGRVSVQDGAAQLAAGLLGLAAGQQVLDACAAPGGKSCHLLELAPEVELTALDLDPLRLEKVRDNLARLQLRAKVLQGDAADPHGGWCKGGYDRILLDVPCSATGVIRRHPDVKYLRRESDIVGLVELQARILRAVWPCLKPGGIMLYATCSILPQENERQLQVFLASQADALEQPIEAQWGEARAVGRQIAPGAGGLDGFYYALLVKRPR